MENNIKSFSNKSSISKFYFLSLLSVGGQPTWIEHVLKSLYHWKDLILIYLASVEFHSEYVTASVKQRFCVCVCGGGGGANFNQNIQSY